MDTVFLALIAGLAALGPGAASAESLRCQAGTASEGDSRLSLLYKCGPPVLADRSCAAVYYGGSVHPLPEPYASAYVPCLPTEELIYERGEGNLVATVRIRGGVIRSITYGRSPR